ncbi:MAG: hypothetical protein KC593_24910, partial [Myxococcales bacterium]|nr:hypothetical protein [Myxococcales bacterium]
GAFDALLRSARGQAQLMPELVLQVGAAPTSKSLELLAEANVSARFVLAPFGRPDPARNAKAILVGDVAAALDRLSDQLAARARSSVPASSYAQTFMGLDAHAHAVIERELAAEGSLTEGAATQAVVDALGDDTGLLLGNSLAIRHVDAYARRSRATGPVHTQRGVSGIDGLIAGAAGAASTGRAMVALLGDVSFLHDLGGLGVHFPGSSLTVVVLQNGGGRIFEMLPIARYPDAPMGSFTTEHGADLRAAAQVFGHDHVAVRTREALVDALAQRVGAPGLHVVEVQVPPHDAVARQRAIYAKVEALMPALPAPPTYTGGPS